MFPRDPEAHHQRRKLMSRGFSQGALMEFEPQISKKIQTLLDQWAKIAATGSEFDAYFWARMFAFDVICEYTHLILHTLSAKVMWPSL